LWEEPGIGKSALLDHAVHHAGGLKVFRVAGIESEMELGFSALHQLLFPYLEDLEAVPGLHREALSSAFGLSDRGPPDRFLVGFAALTLLARVARRSGLLCLVDDAQWLDQESAGVLAFVARRLHADAIAIVFAIRDPSEGPISLHGLPDLHMRGLPPAEAFEVYAGSLVAARAHFAERGAIEAARGGRCDLGEFIVLAWRGQAIDALAQAPAIVSDATERLQGWKLLWVQYALCVLELGLGHYQEALVKAASDARLALWSTREPVTLFGGGGACASGSDEVRRNFRTAVTGIVPCRSFDYDLVAAGGGDELAYTVGYEHISSTRARSRTTHCVSHTSTGEWKVIHRHADYLRQ
jgi:ketosteroid isomerase-like protein